ncbi:hypothetical protein DPMN_115696 [Dreissena polymorpha]|uniref:Uncharacterized protein n=1 Tax=Dreissena polymorpha TaxID=45954 RepID=A0A9D4KMC1_DREPO|nr:hypothetical protein DPMN_115696 [Dreissena polymorpha]
MGTNNFGYETNLAHSAKLGGGLHSRSNLKITSGFPIVTTFEVPPGSFVSGSCPETLD